MERVEASRAFVSRDKRVVLIGVEVMKGRERSEERRRLSGRVVLMVIDVDYLLCTVMMIWRCCACRFCF